MKRGREKTGKLENLKEKEERRKKQGGGQYGVWTDTICFTLSPRRPYEEYKRMVLEHTHGLFIT
jgi:hypothetical protein